VNVLKPYQKGAVVTLLENEVSQREISRKTGIDRKTVRKLALAMAAGRSGDGSNSPTRPPARMACRVKFPHPGHRLLGPARRLLLPGCPRMRARPARRIGSGSKRRCGWVATPQPSTKIWSISLVSRNVITA
jgi:hypothetical protein